MNDNLREREVGLDRMYRVQGTMRDNYYADEDQPRRTNLVSADWSCR